MAIVRQATITKIAKTTRIAAPAAVLSFLSDVGLVYWGGLSDFVRARRYEGREESCDGAIVICNLFEIFMTLMIWETERRN